MSATDAKRLAIVAVIVAGTLAAVRDATNGRSPDVRTLVGVYVGGVMLTVLAEVAPEVAGPLAALMLTTAIFSMAPDTVKAVQNTYDPSPPKEGTPA